MGAIRYGSTPKKRIPTIKPACADFGRASTVVICKRRRLIPLSQIDQYLVQAGRNRNGAEFDFSGGVDRFACMPVAVLRRRGWRRTVGTPLRGLSRPMISK